MITLLIVGNDSLGIQALSSLDYKDIHDLVVVFDKSTRPKRVWRLLRKKRLSLATVLRMAFCEFRRRGSRHSRSDHHFIRSNADLLARIGEVQPDRIVLYRAGLIVNSTVLATGIPVLNIHSARLPDYGGLSSIHRALRDGATKQKATLHRVTQSIDSGEVLDVEPYLLDVASSYCDNEAVAYAAGTRLLQRTVSSELR